MLSFDVRDDQHQRQAYQDGMERFEQWWDLHAAPFIDAPAIARDNDA